MAQQSGRLLSLDVMRGITIAGMILVNNPGSWKYVYTPLEHARWNGLTPTDLVFPFFMFIMGVSMFFSLRKYNFKLSKESVTKVLRRTVLIFLVGLGLNLFGHVCYNGFTDFQNLRILGVMQRLALAYGFGSLIGLAINHKYILHSLREILESDNFRNASSKLAFAVGRDIAGNCIVGDIARLPHMIIAGATGSGKSVCTNSIIMSILYHASPDEVKLILIDPKIVEFTVYEGIPHLLIPVVTDPKKAAGALNWAVQEMQRRYSLFAENSVRDLSDYNTMASQPDSELEPLPQIVVIIDELADLMMTTSKEVEDAICRLAQKARAAGMHLIIATQRPTTDIITGLIKANIPSRIALSVRSQVDSRTILDTGGAEKLLGHGDMLYLPNGKIKPVRVQGCFTSTKEIEKTVSFIKAQTQTQYSDDINQTILDSIFSMTMLVRLDTDTAGFNEVQDAQKGVRRI